MTPSVTTGAKKSGKKAEAKEYGGILFCSAHRAGSNRLTDRGDRGGRKAGSSGDEKVFNHHDNLT